MLTYDLTTIKKGELYEALYKMIRDDIKRGTLTAGEKAAKQTHSGEKSRRQHHHRRKRLRPTHQRRLRYYPAKAQATTSQNSSARAPYSCGKKAGTSTLPQPRHALPPLSFFPSNQTNPRPSFPLPPGKKLLREVIAEESQALMEKSPSGGVLALRQAIAAHLRDFRGIDAIPDRSSLAPAQNTSTACSSSCSAATKSTAQKIPATARSPRSTAPRASPVASPKWTKTASA